jgi:hypothetical protein
VVISDHHAKPELPLDDRQRDPFVRHLDRLGMP